MLNKLLLLSILLIVACSQPIDEECISGRYIKRDTYIFGNGETREAIHWESFDCDDITEQTATHITVHGITLPLNVVFFDGEEIPTESGPGQYIDFGSFSLLGKE